MNADQMTVTATGDGLWDVETPETLFQVIAVRPADRPIIAADDLTCFRAEDGHIHACDITQADYVLGNELLNADHSPDFTALGLAAVRRIIAGQDILSADEL